MKTKEELNALQEELEKVQNIKYSASSLVSLIDDKCIIFYSSNQIIYKQ